MTEVSEETPLWIEHVHAPNQGLDHLGLGTVASDQVLEQLSPGIRALTIHPRYFSFYAFVIDEFWRRSFPRNAVAFRRFYRYCELIYSIGVNACDRDTHRDFAGVVGSSKTQAWALERLNPIPSDLDYIQTSLGGYGLYYRGRLRELEVTLTAGERVPLKDGATAVFAVDQCTPDRGVTLAEAFREAVEDTAFVRNYLGGFEDVPFDVAAEFGRAGCLCGVTNDGAPDRRPLLDMFMHAGRLPDTRRATFRYFLDLADQTEGHALSQARFRRLVYYGADGEGGEFSPRRSTLEAHRGWRLYQAREYYTYALTALWAHLCHWGVMIGGDVTPVPFNEIREHCREFSAPDLVAGLMGVTPPGLDAESEWQDVVQWYSDVSNARSAAQSDRGDVHSAITESSLVDATKDITADTAVAAMFGVLALVTARFGASELMDRPEWDLARMGQDERLSLDGLLRDLERWGSAGRLSLAKVVSRVVERYVIAQHILIASRKMPENTFRFERDGDALRFYAHKNPVSFMDSRFFALSSHLADLGLAGDLSQEQHGLSAEGRVLLEDGDLS